MASPFPGMDPWLEHPSIWPDFHDRLAEEISAALNATLPTPYFAQLGSREELGIIGSEHQPKIVVPDVAVHTPGGPISGTAVADGPRTEVTASLQLRNELQDVNFVEIRDTRDDNEVVTLIEILSPSDKLPGSDRTQYLRKRELIMQSQTSLIEIDLLRCGGRDVFGDYVSRELSQLASPPEYVVLVQRAWVRGKWIDVELFPAPLRQSLPVVAVPLRENDGEVTLDLQYAFQQTYIRGPYARGAVDYSKAPKPALVPHDQEWARQCIGAWQR